MRLWTIQPIEFWKSLKENGGIFSDTKIVENCFSLFPEYEENYIDEKWKFAYEWLSCKMKEKIGYPPIGVKYPIWAYYKWNGVNKKPDLRSYRYSYINKQEEDWVRIGFNIDENFVVLSDIDKWGSVLSGLLVGGTICQNNFDKKMIKYTGVDYLSVTNKNIPNFLKNEIIKSWDKIFELKRNKDEEDWYGPQKSACVQATFWNIKINQVIKVDFFKKYNKKGFNNVKNS